MTPFPCSILNAQADLDRFCIGTVIGLEVKKYCLVKKKKDGLKKNIVPVYCNLLYFSFLMKLLIIQLLIYLQSNELVYMKFPFYCFQYFETVKQVKWVCFFSANHPFKKKNNEKHFTFFIMMFGYMFGISAGIFTQIFCQTLINNQFRKPNKKKKLSKSITVIICNLFIRSNVIC